MEQLGYFTAILIGLSLGLVGGGGSILTVPVLVYFFNIEPMLATTYSLFVVGITSLAGSISHFKMGNINTKIALLFGVPSLIAVFVMRRFVMPSIPNAILDLGTFQLSKPVLLMTVFSILMIAAAISMIKSRTKVKNLPAEDCSCSKLSVQGAAVGIVTGFVGVGGGFLIIPSLVLFAGLPMKKAVGTSLAIMAISSLLGVTADIATRTDIDYSFLSIFSLLAIMGILIGTFLNKFVDEKKLKPAFGWFVLIVGIVVLTLEFS